MCVGLCKGVHGMCMPPARVSVVFLVPLLLRARNVTFSLSTQCTPSNSLPANPYLPPTPPWPPSSPQVSKERSSFAYQHDCFQYNRPEMLAYLQRKKVRLGPFALDLCDYSVARVCIVSVLVIHILAI